MADFALVCFGPPTLNMEGKTVKLSRKKSLALLAYLAVTGIPHTRDALSAFLWPDTDSSHSLAYLRMALSDINSAAGEKFIEADRETVCIAPGASLTLDVAEFREAIAAYRRTPEKDDKPIECLKEASEIYAADFLCGFSLKDAPPFDEWQFFTEEELTKDFRFVLEELIAHYSRTEDYDRAVELAQKLLRTDELNETYHRSLMQLYALNGEVNAAVRQYRNLCRLLEKELGVPPDDETLELYGKLNSMRKMPAGGAAADRLEKVLHTAVDKKRESRESIKNEHEAQPKHEPAEPSETIGGKMRILLRKPLFLLPLTAVLTFAVSFTLVSVLRTNRRQNAEAPILAVMPLRANSEKEEDLWFAEAMTDALITELAMMETIRVKSHTTMTRYRNVDLTVSEIARELNTDYILEGMVVRFEDGIRVSAQLIDGKNDEHVFSKMYESDSVHIQSLQAELAQEISQKIFERLDPKVAEQVEKTGVLFNPQCEAGYLLSWYHLGIGLTEEEEERYFVLIGETIEQDPHICHEYLKQSDLFWNNAFFGQLPPERAEILARKAIQRMLEIDPTSAYAYLVTGILELIYRHDEAEAERFFKDALERGPGKPEVHRWYAALKIVTGEYGAAMEHLEKARTFDPYHRMNAIFRASALYYAGRYEQAIVEARRYIDDAGENRLPYLIQSWSLIQLGRYEEAQANLLHCHELKGGSESLAYLGYVYGKTGRTKEAWRVLSQLSLSASGEYPSHVLRAIVYAGLEERDEVAAELEQAFERKEPYLLWKHRDPVLAATAADTDIHQQAALQSNN